MKQCPGDLPSTIGVYIFKTSKGEILYIGKSVNIKARIKSHFENAKLDLKERAIIAGSSHIETIATESEFKALILESSLIQKHRPKYNKIWMDGKSYLYVQFTMREEYPKIRFVRRSDIDSLNFQVPISKFQTSSKFQKDPSDSKSPQDDVNVNSKYSNFKQKKRKKDLFFGPFSSRRTLENLLREIRRVIPFCTSKRLTTRSCFYSKIGLCDPCPNYINRLEVDSHGLEIDDLHGTDFADDNKRQRNQCNPFRENPIGYIRGNPSIQKEYIGKLKQEYKNNIKEIIKIFQGKTEIVLKDLRKELNILSKDQKYEEGLLMRNRIERFERLISERNFNNDIFSVGAEHVQPLQEIIKILRPYFVDVGGLHRVECYDVSNLNFKEATAAMTVAVEGQVDKSEYRKFRIQSSSLRSAEGAEAIFSITNQIGRLPRHYVPRNDKKGDTDWDLMHSVFLRRFKHTEWEFPQLLVVDGGKPQVKMAVSCMQELKLQIPVIGIAKNPDRLVIGVSDLPTIRPEINNSGFNLIRLLRDEAHRFGRKYHLFLREKGYNKI